MQELGADLIEGVRARHTWRVGIYALATAAALAVVIVMTWNAGASITAAPGVQRATTF